MLRLRDEQARECLSDLALERHLHGLSGDPASLEAHLATCERCGRRMASKVTEGDRFEAVVLPTLSPLQSLHRTIGSPAETTPPHWWRRARIPMAVAATVVVGIVASLLLYDMLDHRGAPVEEQAFTTIKGLAPLRVYVKQDEVVSLLGPGSVLHPGDALRFVPDTGDFPLLLVVSLEESGQGSVYHPLGGKASGPVGVPGEPIEGSVILDDALGSERICAFFSSHPLAGADAISFVASLDETALMTTGLVEERSWSFDEGATTEAVLVMCMAIVKEAR